MLVAPAATGPPRRDPPTIGPATITQISPTMATVGETLTVRVKGSNFTEEFGAGTLKCRFLFDGNKQVDVYAYRVLGDCLSVPEQQFACPTDELECTLPAADSPNVAQHVELQVANDVNVQYQTIDPDDADKSWVLVDWAERWSNRARIAFVPAVSAVQDTAGEVGTTKTLTVLTQGLPTSGGGITGFSTRCVFALAGFGGLFPPPFSLRFDRQNDELWYITTAATIINGTALTCDSPNVKYATSFTVHITVDWAGGASVSTCDADLSPCDHVGASEATYAVVPKTDGISPALGPIGVSYPLTIPTSGLRRNEAQRIRVTCPQDLAAPLSGTFTLEVGATATTPIDIKASESAVVSAIQTALVTDIPSLGSPSYDLVRVALVKATECGGREWVVWFVCPLGGVDAGDCPSLSTMKLHSETLTPPVLDQGRGTQFVVETTTRCLIDEHARPSGLDTDTLANRTFSVVPDAVEADNVVCYNPINVNGHIVQHFRVTQDAELRSSLDLLKALYYNYPIPHRMWPSRGPLYGGTEITIHGSGFANTSTLSCHFSLAGSAVGAGAITSATYVDTRTVRCPTPPAANVSLDGGAVPTSLGDERTVVVEVAMDDNRLSNTTETEEKLQLGSLRNRFTYYVVAILNDIHPFSGPYRGGTTVKLFGQHFNRTSEAYCAWDIDGDVVASAAELRELETSIAFTKATVHSDTFATCASPPVRGTPQEYAVINVRLTNDIRRVHDEWTRPLAWNEPRDNTWQYTLHENGDFSNPMRFAFQPDIQVLSVNTTDSGPFAPGTTLRMHSGGMMGVSFETRNMVPDLRPDGPRLTLNGDSSNPASCPAYDNTSPVNGGDACQANPAITSTPDGFAVAYEEESASTASARDIVVARYDLQNRLLRRDTVRTGIVRQVTISHILGGTLLAFAEDVSGNFRIRALRFDSMGNVSVPSFEFDALDGEVGCQHPFVVPMAAGFAVGATCMDNAAPVATIALYRWSPVNYTIGVETPFLLQQVYRVPASSFLGAVELAQADTPSGVEYCLAVFLGDSADGGAISLHQLDLVEEPESAWDVDASLFTARNKYRENVQLQLSTGLPVGNFAVGTRPQIALLFDGTVAAAWQDAAGSGVRAARLSLFPSLQALMPDTRVDKGAVPTDAQRPAISALEAGFVVVWEAAERVDEGPSLLGMRYVADGADTTEVGLTWYDFRPTYRTVGREFRVHQSQGPLHVRPAVTPLPSGGIIVSYRSLYNDGQALRVRVVARRFSDVMMKCRMGEKTVYARLRAPKEVQCVLPPYQVDNGAPLELTNNADDYTAGATAGTEVQVYPTCPAGSYCPDHRDQDRHAANNFYVPCPVGHYCPHDSMFEPTPCPPGTFQPYVGRDACYPCPLGYQCPSLRMELPELCREGFVCDRVGTITPTMLCPQGHYCFPGTAVNATDCCYQDTPGDYAVPTCACYQDATAAWGNASVGVPGLWSTAGVAIGEAVVAGSAIVPSDFDAEVYLGRDFRLTLENAGTSVQVVVDSLAPFNSSVLHVVADHALEGANSPTQALAALQGSTVNVYWRMHGELDKFVTVPARPLRCPDSYFCGPGVVSNVSVGCNVNTRPNCYLTPQPCAAGKRCEAGSKTPDGTAEAPPGTYKPYILDVDDMMDSNGKEMTPYEKCGVNTYMDQGYLTTDCDGTQCSSAEYCSFNYTTNVGTCQEPPKYFCECPRGHFCPGFGNLEPRMCRPSQYNQWTGQDRCHTCNVGFTCPNTAQVLQQPCRPGFVCNEQGLSTDQTLCNSGFFCLEGVRTEETNTVRNSATNEIALDYGNYTAYYADEPVGQAALLETLLNTVYSAVEKYRLEVLKDPYQLGWLETHRMTLEAAVGPALEQLQTWRIPLPCPEGFYCLAGVLSPVPVPGNFSTPQYCMPGTICKIGTRGPEGTRRCPPGTFCPLGMHTPILALEGTYAPGFGNSVSTDCFPGTFAARRGQALCTTCPKGFTCPGLGRNDTILSPAGRLVERRGQSTANTRCPAGFYCPEGLISSCTEFTEYTALLAPDMYPNVWTGDVGASFLFYNFTEAGVDCKEEVCDFTEIINVGENLDIKGKPYLIVGLNGTYIDVTPPLQDDASEKGTVVQRAPCARCTADYSCNALYTKGKVEPDPVSLTKVQPVAQSASDWETQLTTTDYVIDIATGVEADVCNGERLAGMTFQFLFDGSNQIQTDASQCSPAAGHKLLPSSNVTSPVLNVTVASGTVKFDSVEVTFALSNGQKWADLPDPLPFEASAVDVNGTSGNGWLGELEAIPATEPPGDDTPGTMWRQRIALPQLVKDRLFVNGSFVDFNETVPYTAVSLRLRAAEALSAASIVVHITEVRLFTREVPYMSGEIVLAHRAKEGVPFPTDCCARPTPCPEGTYCLGGVRTLELDFTGVDFTAPQWCIEGSFCGTASASPTGDGLCPAGYYCPPGTPRPRPCWKGHACSGEGSGIPLPCRRGTYASSGIYPPTTFRPIFGIQDPEYKQYLYLEQYGSRRCRAYCCQEPCVECLPPSYPNGPMRNCTGASVIKKCLPFPGEVYGCAGEGFDPTRSTRFSGDYDWDWFPIQSKSDNVWRERWASNPGNTFPDLAFESSYCPSDGVRDCDGRCTTATMCQVLANNWFNCSSLLGNGRCENGTLRTGDSVAGYPNLNCAKFGFDGGDCAAEGRPDMTRLITDKLNVISCRDPANQCVPFQPDPEYFYNASMLYPKLLERGLQEVGRLVPLDVAICAIGSYLKAEDGSLKNLTLEYQSYEVTLRAIRVISACGDADQGLVSPGMMAVWPNYPTAQFQNFVPTLEEVTLAFDASIVVKSGAKDLTTWPENTGLTELPWFQEEEEEPFTWQLGAAGAFQATEDTRLPQVTGALKCPEGAAWMASLARSSLSGTEIERLYFTQYRNMSVEMLFSPESLTGSHVLFETGGNAAGVSLTMEGSDIVGRVKCANEDAELVEVRHGLWERNMEGYQHVVMVLRLLGAGKSPHLSLYHNGEFVALTASNSTCERWASESRSGLCDADPGGDVVGVDSATFDAKFTPFNGSVSLINIYLDNALEIQQARMSMRWRELDMVVLDGWTTGGPDDLVGASQCLQCPAGHYCPDEGTIWPIPCRTGQYRNGTSNKVMCDECSEGKFSYRMGLEGDSQCTPCPAGTVCVNSGADDLNSAAFVEPCPGGFFCPNGTQKATQRNYACAAGMYCREGTIPPVDFSVAGRWKPTALLLEKLSDEEAQVECSQYKSRDQYVFIELESISADCTWEYTGEFIQNMTFIPKDADTWPAQDLVALNMDLGRVAMSLEASVALEAELVASGKTEEQKAVARRDAESASILAPALNGVALGTAGDLFFLIERNYDLIGNLGASRSELVLAAVHCGHQSEFTGLMDLMYADFPEALTSRCRMRAIQNAVASPRPAEDFILRPRVAGGSFFLCSPGYECRTSTAAVDTSRLRYRCTDGVICPKGTAGPVVASCEGLCRPPRQRMAFQFLVALPMNVSTSCAQRTSLGFNLTLMDGDGQGVSVFSATTTSVDWLKGQVRKQPRFAKDQERLRAGFAVANNGTAAIVTLLNGPYEEAVSFGAGAYAVTSNDPCAVVTRMEPPNQCCTATCLNGLDVRCNHVASKVDSLSCPRGSTGLEGSNKPDDCVVDWSCLDQDETVFSNVKTLPSSPQDIMVLDNLLSGSCPVILGDEVFVGDTPLVVEEVNYDYANADPSFFTFAQPVPTSNKTVSLVRDGQPQSILSVLRGCLVPNPKAGEPPLSVSCDKSVPDDLKASGQSAYDITPDSAPFRTDSVGELPPVYIPSLTTAVIEFDFSHVPANATYNFLYWLSIYVSPPGTVEKTDIERMLLPEAFESKAAGVQHWGQRHRFSIHTEDAVELRISVDVLHGLFDYSTNHDLFYRCATVTFVSSSRMRLGTSDTLIAVIRKDVLNPDEGKGTVLPTNLRKYDFGEPPRKTGGCVLSYLGKEGELLVAEPQAMMMDDATKFWRTLDQYGSCEADDLMRNCSQATYSYATDKQDLNARPYSVQNGKMYAVAGTTRQYYRPFQQVLPMLTLPFVSNCLELGTSIQLSMLFEDASRCALIRDAERHTTPSTVLPDGRTDLGIPANLTSLPGSVTDTDSNIIADRCQYETQCLYQEFQSTPRDVSDTYWWVERNEKTPLFYFLDDPAPPGKAFEETFFNDIIRNSPLSMIPVTSYYRTQRGTDRQLRYVPTLVELEVKYHQISTTEKKVVQASMFFSDFRDTQATPDCPTGDNRLVECEAQKRMYRLQVRFVPMSWVELLDAFALPFISYIGIYVLVCAPMLLVSAIIAVVARFRASGEGPSLRVPTFMKLKLKPAAAASISIAVCVSSLAMVGYLLVVTSGADWLDAFPANVNVMMAYGDLMMTSCEDRRRFREPVEPGLSCLTKDSIARGRAGRLGWMFAVLSVIGASTAIRALVPDRNMERFLKWKAENKEVLAMKGKSKEEKARIKEEIAAAKKLFLPYDSEAWNPVSWQRAHLKFTNFVEMVAFIMLLEVGALRPVRNNGFLYTVALKFMKWGLTPAIRGYLHEELLAAPFILAFSLMELANALTATDFRSFLLFYTLTALADPIKRVLDPALDRWLNEQPLEPTERDTKERNALVRDALDCSISIMACATFACITPVLLLFQDQIPIFVLRDKHVVFTIMVAVMVMVANTVATYVNNVAWGRDFTGYMEQMSRTKPFPKPIQEMEDHMNFTLSIDEALRSLHESGMGLRFHVLVGTYGTSIFSFVLAGYMLKSAGGSPDLMWGFMLVVALILINVVKKVFQQAEAKVLPPALPVLAEYTQNRDFMNSIFDTVEHSTRFEHFMVDILQVVERRLAGVLFEHGELKREKEERREIARAVLKSSVAKRYANALESKYIGNAKTVAALRDPAAAGDGKKAGKKGRKNVAGRTKAQERAMKAEYMAIAAARDMYTISGQLMDPAEEQELVPAYVTPGLEQFHTDSWPGELAGEPHMIATAWARPQVLVAQPDVCRDFREALLLALTGVDRAHRAPLQALLDSAAPGASGASAGDSVDEPSRVAESEQAWGMSAPDAGNSPASDSSHSSASPGERAEAGGRAQVAGLGLGALQARRPVPNLTARGVASSRAPSMRAVITAATRVAYHGESTIRSSSSESGEDSEEEEEKTGPVTAARRPSRTMQSQQRLRAGGPLSSRRGRLSRAGAAAAPAASGTTTGTTSGTDDEDTEEGADTVQPLNPVRQFGTQRPEPRYLRSLDRISSRNSRTNSRGRVIASELAVPGRGTSSSLLPGQVTVRGRGRAASPPPSAVSGSATGTTTGTSTGTGSSGSDDETTSG